MGQNFGDESRGVSEAASHREENAENDLRKDIEGKSGVQCREWEWTI